jgi:2,3-bisphosphoglycerate-independent phosphoglycerate mutase
MKVSDRNGKPARPVVLVICDGWGVRDETEGNAIARARTPNFHRMLSEYPSTRLVASGEDVGLPAGQMGNSEVGHLNLGAGRMVPQDILRIDLAIRDGSFFENPALRGACENARSRPAALHLMGLVSDGGVHSHENHLIALLELAARLGPQEVFVHAFLDGRDTPPQSAPIYVKRLQDAISRIGTGRIATISGRYYAMDRDKRWDRSEKAYAAIVRGKGNTAASAAQALADAALRSETDEFVLPTVVEEGGFPVGRVRDGDAVIFFNFRADRARQLTEAMTQREFGGFSRGSPPDVSFACMTEYKKEFALPVAFPPQRLVNILADVWEKAGVRNLRLAETEKYAHVTYFFNGGVEKEYGGESRLLVPSPKVATYDLQPQMAAPEITERALEAVSSDRYDAIVLNYANADMVGHTGRLEPTVEAVECLDRCLGQLMEPVLARGGALLMTGDHGNAEQMIDPKTGEPQTAHTTNPVPLIVATRDDRRPLASGGALKDVAPTILGLMKIRIPKEMTGRDLRLRNP